MQLRSSKIKDFPRRPTLWVKRWSGNGEYPINVYVYDCELDGYYLLSSAGKPTFFYLEHEMMDFFSNNLLLVSDTLLVDTTQFNFE